MSQSPDDLTLQLEHVAPVADKACWRCRKLVPGSSLQCPYCAAQFETSVPPCQEVVTAATPLVKILLMFALMAIIGGVNGLVMQSRLETGFDAADKASVILPQVLVFNLVFTVLVIYCWMHVRPARHPSPWQHTWAAWPTGMVALTAALVVNLAYHQLVGEVLGVPQADSAIKASMQYWPLWLLAICVQPAIMEELFFRRIVFDALLPVLSGHGTVLLSSIMFAMLHIGAPLSLPVLLLVGLVLGYSRWFSGGIWLPIMLHFVHNFVVVALEVAV